MQTLYDCIELNTFAVNEPFTEEHVGILKTLINNEINIKQFKLYLLTVYGKEQVL